MKPKSYKGIPAKDRPIVSAMLAVYAAKGERISRKAAWLRVQAGRASLAKEAAQREASQKEAWKDANKKTVEESIRKLAVTRDFLDSVAAGHEKIDAHDAAMFAKAALVESMSEMEQALFSLGLVPGMAGIRRGHREGWFKESLQ